jgi:hypothetical protein
MKDVLDDVSAWIDDGATQDGSLGQRLPGSGS